jgi:hypothetical protein
VFIYTTRKAEREFVIQDPAMQTVKWLIVIEEKLDKKVKRYEVDTEFDATVCDCIFSQKMSNKV